MGMGSVLVMSSRVIPTRKEGFWGLGLQGYSKPQKVGTSISYSNIYKKYQPKIYMLFQLSGVLAKY